MRLISILMIFVFAGLTGAQVKEPDPVYYFNASWSPDGKKILFESTRDGKYAIYSIQFDGSGLAKLTVGDFDNEQPRWSPNGRQIVFISTRDGHSQLYIMTADGADQRRLTNGPDNDYVPAFSPKGDMVVFSVNESPFSIRTDGTERKPLAGFGEMPKSSPDGKRLLFVRKARADKKPWEMTKEERAKLNNSAEIYVSDANGSHATNLTNNNVRDSGANWSWDSKTIYFISERDGEPNVYSMKPDGTGTGRVASGLIVAETNISPNGKYFAYTKQVDKKYGLYVFEIKTGKETLLIGGK
jgi:TolB protein